MPADPGSLPDPRRVAGHLSDEKWQRLIVQLGRYALQKSRKFYWRTGSSGELPDGERVQSMVSKALVLWLDGTRRWRRSEYPDLQHFLMGVIDSLLSHAARGYDNRAFQSGSFGSGESADARQSSPEDELLERERAAEADTTLREIIRRSEQDAAALNVIDAIRNGAETRREIIKATGQAAEVVDNALKRLRRTGASVARSRGHEFQRAR